MAKKRVQVRFDGCEDDEKDKNNIDVDLIPPNKVNLSLGILKSFHRYRIEAIIPKSILDQLSITNEERPEHHSDNIKLQVFETDKTGLNLIVELCTGETQNLDETLTYGQMVIHYKASVLGPHKGTPYLKKNIHLLAKLSQGDSSDDD